MDNQLQNQLDNNETNGFENQAALERLLSKIFEVVPAGIVYLDPDLRILRINPLGAFSIGARGESIEGKLFFDVTTTPHSGLAVAFKKVLSDHQQLSFWGYPIPDPNKSGEKTFWDYTLHELEGGILLFAVEVTERVRNERNLQSAIEAARQSAAKLQSVIDQMTDGVIVCDENCQVLTINNAAVQLLGEAAIELYLKNSEAEESLNLIRRLNGEIFPAEEYPWRLAGSDGTISVNTEMVVRRGEQDEATISVNAAPLFDKNEKLTGAVAVFHDVTENRRIISELQQANRRLEEYNRLKAEFVANMSHELRTPLTAIIGFAQLVQMKIRSGEASPETIRDGLERILRNGRHLLTLIDEVLDLSKLEAGRLTLHPEHFNVAELVEKTFADLESLAIKKELGYTIKINGDFKQLAYTDPSRVRQILLNLLSNAIKFTDRGEVKVALEQLENENWSLTVRDSGVGIKEEDLREIFERFRQVDGSSTRAAGGTGLGLSISQQLAEVLGGKITVESDFGKGSAFTLTLPFVAPRVSEMFSEAKSEEFKEYEFYQNGNANGQEKTAEKPSESGDRRPLVLVVDDTPDAQMILSETLEKAGYRVAVAASGAEGIRRARELRPDAISLDIMMPNMDGWRVLQELKADSFTARIPVVVCSIVDNKALGYRLGASGYLVKPVEPVNLLETLRAVGTTPDKGERDYVLVVDDEHGVRDLLISALKQGGFRAKSASSGEIALSVAEKNAPAAILADLHMPGGMSGYELIARLRSQPETASVPIVVVTGKDLSIEDRRFIRGQIAEVIRKGDLLLPNLEERLRDTLGEIGVEPANG